MNEISSIISGKVTCFLFANFYRDVILTFLDVLIWV